MVARELAATAFTMSPPDGAASIQVSFLHSQPTWILTGPYRRQQYSVSLRCSCFFSCRSTAPLRRVTLSRSPCWQCGCSTSLRLEADTRMTLYSIQSDAIVCFASAVCMLVELQNLLVKRLCLAHCSRGWHGQDEAATSVAVVLLWTMFTGG